MNKKFFTFTILLLNLIIANAQWQQTNGPTATSIISSLGVVDNKIYAGSYDSTFVSNDNGQSWKSVPNMYRLTGSIIHHNNIFYAGTSGGLYHSEDHGNTWNIYTSSLTVTTIYSLTANSNTIYSTSNGGAQVIYSTDNGNTWTSVNDYFIPNMGNILATDSILFTTPYSPYPKCVLITKDNGTTWIYDTLGLNNSFVSCFVSHGTNILASTYSNGIYKYNGPGWTNICDSLTLTSIISVGKYLFGAKYNDGIWFSSDDGLSWKPFSTGLENKLVTSLTMTNTHFYAGTNGQGVYKHALDSLVGIQHLRKLNPELTVSPNPFKNHSRLSFHNPHEQFVLINLYDIHGNVIYNIENKKLAAGPYTYDVNATSAGVYLLSVAIGDQKYNLKIIRTE